MPCLAALILTLAATALSEPIVIKTGISKANEHAQHQDSGVYDNSAKTGISNFEAADGFNLGKDKKYVSQEDAGKYDEENVDKKHHVEEGKFDGQKFHDKSGGSVADLANEVAHKKGHHRSGFHNSYHKDESGSNTSFYDDGEDHGKEFVQNSQKGVYGDVAHQANQGSHLDGRGYAREDGRRGGYNNGDTYLRDSGDRRNYNQNNYHDDRQLRGNTNQGNRFGEVAHRNEEEYYVRPHVVHHLPPPLPPRVPYYPPDRGYYGQPYVAPVEPRKITIYEDPRYVGYDAEPQYSDDYVTLDVRRSPSSAYYDYRNYD